jgi:hypothetical protein
MVLALTEIDALALSMLGMLVITFGMLFGLGLCMFRNASKRDEDVDRLLEDIAEDEKTGEKLKTGGVEKREEWERDGDWWKSGE